MDEIIQMVWEFGTGEAWSGPAVALLHELNTIWQFEIMGMEFTEESETLRHEFIEMMRAIEGGLTFGWWEEGAAEKITAGAKHLEQFYGYGDQSENLAVILADIKDDMRW